MEKVTTLMRQAREFSRYAHRNQVRKYTGEPYYNHPLSVASILLANGYDETVVAAGFLHDTIEDCEVTWNLLYELFGADVANTVDMVSDRSKPSDGNRAERKAIDRAHLAQADWRGQAVKLADILDNGYDIAQNDPSFAKKYFEEINDLLNVALKDERNRVLRDRAVVMVSNYRTSIGLPPFVPVKLDESSEATIRAFQGD
jgi:(p)ppGpp synthase/HD superfamily hydrolase